jgi:hypothetical protein
VLPGGLAIFRRFGCRSGAITAAKPIRLPRRRPFTSSQSGAQLIALQQRLLTGRAASLLHRHPDGV